MFLQTHSKELQKKDVKVLLFIDQQDVDESIFPLIVDATKSKDTQDALQSGY